MQLDKLVYVQFTVRHQRFCGYSDYPHSSGM
uniref:Uncharacterized protein n=1 Tax=Anguilla anguilla TaxID=7936 RepID=A0A0E9VLN9_ANGAN